MAIRNTDLGGTDYQDTGSTLLNGAIDDSVSTITVDSTTGFKSGGGSVRIEEELIDYAGVTATTFTGCTRGQYGTTAASHLDNATVSEKEVVKSVDLNDTFDALANKANTLTAFWLNSDLSEPYDDIDANYTLTEDIGVETYSTELTGTNHVNGAVNPDNAFDENSATFASTNADGTYVGRTFTSTYVWGLYVYIVNTMDSNGNTALLQTYDGTTWTTVYTFNSAQGSWKGLIGIDDTVQGIRFIETATGSGAHYIYRLDAIYTKPTVDAFSSFLRIGVTDATNFTTTIEEDSTMPDGLTRRVYDNFISAVTSTRTPSITGTLAFQNSNEDKHYYFEFQLSCVQSFRGPGITVGIYFDATNNYSISIGASGNGSSILENHVCYMISKTDGTIDVYIDGFFEFNISKTNLNLRAYLTCSGGFTDTPRSVNGHVFIREITQSKGTV